MMSKERIKVLVRIFHKRIHLQEFINTMSSEVPFLISQFEELKPSSNLPSFSEILLFTGAGYVCPCLSDKT